MFLFLLFIFTFEQCVAEIYCNKYAIQGAFLLSQQFFKGFSNKIKNCATSKKLQCHLFNETWHLHSNSDLLLDRFFFLKIKVSKSRKQFMTSSILPKNERNSLSLASSISNQDSKFCALFGKIEETIIYFRELLTFLYRKVFSICSQPQ